MNWAGLSQAAWSTRQRNINKNRPRALKAVPVSPATDAFLTSPEWRRLRYDVLQRHGRKCMCCGAGPEQGAVLNVDHIKPRKTHPHLALDIRNLQVLCEGCNVGKGNRDETDFRPRQLD